ncbi:uncharacterized protein PV09_07358 [Verruconis gallopava]|uniref:Uncharacterized protein n=1 Tax=Verruconis gallopava TaxID=253628 RepID=A0A0D1XFV7_9PEZI|nr:uncharacterized protein PV09_07358 [Verruconis gallopava]KIW01066.1 hypothetical protein PV09_07358 [Verruconis gallopava]
MTATFPQLPPTAYFPQSCNQSNSDKSSIFSSRDTSKSRSPDNTLSHEYTPFFPAPSSKVGSLTTISHSKSLSLDSCPAVGISASEKTFSSLSSGASSPASLTYSPAVQSALRDSCHSSISSHYSAMASPYPLGNNPQTDPEKRQAPTRNSRLAASDETGTGRRCASSSLYGLPEREDDEATFNLENKALSILLYLSFPNCVVSFIILLYTLLALLTATLLQPLRICTSAGSFWQQVAVLLAPTLNIQLAYIHSSYSAIEYSASMLVIVNLLSPLLSLGVAGAAWVAAAFWFFNAILGDPDGSDKPRGYNDGRASVIGVRRWWETWLRRPLRHFPR